MVNRRLRPTPLVSLVRRHARRRRLSVVEEPGRGKGSHRLFLVQDEAGREVGRFVVLGHARELSWTVLRSIEDALAPVLGERWMEEK